MENLNEIKLPLNNIDNNSNVPTLELIEDFQRIKESFDFAEQFDCEGLTIARHTHTDGTELDVAKIDGYFVISNY